MEHHVLAEQGHDTVEQLREGSWLSGKEKLVRIYVQHHH